MNLNIYDENKKNKKPQKKNFENCICLNLIIIAFPIAIYLLLQHLGTFIDYLIVGQSKKTINIKQTITYMKQTQKFLQSIGIGLGSAGTILVAREYNKKKKELARKYATLSFLLSLAMSIIIFLILYLGILLPYPFCNLFLNKDYFSDGGLEYYLISLITFVFITINTVFMSLERAKGKKKFLLMLNILIIVSRILFTYICKIIYGIQNVSVVHLSYSNLSSHLIISLIAFYYMFFNSKNDFKLKFKGLIFSKKLIKKIISLSMTIVIGKTTYDYGKKIILDMANSFYGKESVLMITVGYVALINGIFYSISQSFEEAQTVLISKNIAIKKKTKTLIILKKVFFITFIIGVLGILVNKFMGIFLLNLLQNGRNLNNEEIKGFKIGLFWEQTSLFTSIWASLMINFIITYKKKAKIFFWINFLRIILRIFILWILKKFELILKINPYTQFSLSTFCSNLIILVLTIIIFFSFLKKNYKKNIENINFLN